MSTEITQLEIVQQSALERLEAVRKEQVEVLERFYEANKGGLSAYEFYCFQNRMTDLLMEESKFQGYYAGTRIANEEGATS